MACGRWPENNRAMPAQKVHPNFKAERPRYHFRAWRKYRGLTQQQVADRTSLSESAVSQIENGKQGWTDSTLAELAFAYNCEPGDLLSRDPLREGEIVDLLQRLDGAKRIEALNYLRFITREAG